MIPNVRDRTIASKGVTESGEFGISLADSAHIMTILRDTLYSDKILAVLREYGANAWDSHRMAGKSDVPIKIVLPTRDNPTLTIQDFGIGLSKDDVFQVFTQYGASTKRGSDTAVGMLGIGSKSGFAYSDSFTVISCHGGSKCTYVAVLDQTEKGVINLLNEEPCKPEETGVMIQLAIRPHDIHEFGEKAKKLFKYFKPQPDINVELPKLPPSQVALTNGVIYSTKEYCDDDKRWKAIMGCVPYRIDLGQLTDAKGESTVSKAIHNITGALFFDIGEVQISASREELKYSDSTKAAITKRFESLVDEYVKQTLDGIVSQKLNPWEQRIRLQILHTLHLPVPKEWEAFSERHIDLEEVKLPDSFTICSHGAKPIKRLTVSDSTRLVLKTEHKAVGAFQLASYDYLVRRTAQEDWDVVQKDLNKFVSKLGLDGIPIIDITKINKDPHYVPKTALERLKGRMFRFEPAKGISTFYSPYSPHWKPIKRDPTDTDIYVIMRKFKPTFYNFFRKWQEDLELSEALGLKMPEVIGYRTTKKEPISEGSVPGKLYEEWSTARRVELLKLPEYLKWLEMSKISTRYGGHDFGGIHIKKVKGIVTKLGDDHPIAKVISKRLEIGEYFKTINGHQDAFETLGKANVYSVPQPELRAIKDTYKLLERSTGHDPISEVLRDKLTGHWLKYINAIDNPRKTHVNDTPEVHDDE